MGGLALDAGVVNINDMWTVHNCKVTSDSQPHTDFHYFCAIICIVIVSWDFCDRTMHSAISLRLPVMLLGFVIIHPLFVLVSIHHSECTFNSQIILL